MNSINHKNLCKIRTITSFLTLSNNKKTWKRSINDTASFLQSLCEYFTQHNYIVQSIRIVTNPFGEYLDTSNINNTIDDMHYLSTLLQNHTSSKVRLRFGIGEAKSEKELEIIPTLINKFGDISNICVNVQADDLGIPDYNLTQKCAKIVKEISQITPNGEGNFNFTINYNCKPHIPYFPASYHTKYEQEGFAIGLESTDLLVHTLKTLSFNQNHNEYLQQSHHAMKNSLQTHINNITTIINNFTHQNKTQFLGFDSSAAPSKRCSSIVDIYKLLGVEYFGSAGTVAISALLTKTFKSLENCNLLGFSGLMLAVLEDEGLAHATKKQQFDIKDLLSYSAICGIGLDTVPIAGDTSIEKIASICQDTGTMAYRLNKPLTVRLFPAPNLKQGDTTNFQSDDLCNATVLKIP